MGIALACVLIVSVQSVAEVRDPRPASLVVDQANVLSPAEERQLDDIAAALERARGAQIAIVTVDNTPGSPKVFATALFNAWHLGHRGADDGVLVLLVVGQRRLEIETGDGMQRALPASWLADMQARDMVPAFKRQLLGAGLVAGVTAIDGRLRALPGEADTSSPSGEYRSDSVVVPPTAPVSASPSAAPVPASTPAAPVPASTSAASAKKPAPPVAPPPTRSYDEPSPRDYGPALAIGALCLLGVGSIAGARALRRRQRRCPTCQQQMTRLDDSADDAHLDAVQRLEEEVGAIDYRVLRCPGCAFVKVTPSIRLLSDWSSCEKCTRRTWRTKRHMMIEATTNHGGEFKTIGNCAHCGHHTVSYVTTPPVMRFWTAISLHLSSGDSSAGSSTSSSSWSDSSSRRSSSDDSSSSRSSSSHASSSRSSSSRSSGGSSSGGGAGSSW